MMPDEAKQQVIAASAPKIGCRWCGKLAQWVDWYRAPFDEDRTVFKNGMSVYYCASEHLGFAHPVPSRSDLAKYYQNIYRDVNRLCQEDPHIQYKALASTPLAESQYMYLALFIDFDALKTVIDMGCGHGMLLRVIRKYHPHIRLIGVELDTQVESFLAEIGATYLPGSAAESVEAICSAVTDDTLLVSSHALHYQDDIAFVREIIHRVKTQGNRNVHVFIEVPNDIVNEQEYVRNRVYDVPKLIFFTVEALQNNLFDLEVVHLVTNGWTMDEELAFRKRRLNMYYANKNKFFKRQMMGALKRLLPIGVRKTIKAILFTRTSVNEHLPYFSYNGKRRAIRFLGKIS